MNILKIIVLLLLVLTTPAFAYTDPGSGLLILQLLGSALVGVLFYFKKIKEWICSKLGKTKDDQK
jgi:hypothetical protein